MFIEPNAHQLSSFLFDIYANHRQYMIQNAFHIHNAYIVNDIRFLLHITRHYPLPSPNTMPMHRSVHSTFLHIILKCDYCCWCVIVNCLSSIYSLFKCGIFSQLHTFMDSFAVSCVCSYIVNHRFPRITTRLIPLKRRNQSKVMRGHNQTQKMSHKRNKKKRFPTPVGRDYVGW